MTSHTHRLVPTAHALGAPFLLSAHNDGFSGRGQTTTGKDQDQDQDQSHRDRRPSRIYVPEIRSGVRGDIERVAFPPAAEPGPGTRREARGRKARGKASLPLFARWHTVMLVDNGLATTLYTTTIRRRESSQRYPIPARKPCRITLWESGSVVLYRAVGDLTSSPNARGYHIA